MTDMEVVIIANSNQIKTDYKVEKQLELKTNIKAKLAKLDVDLFLLQFKILFFLPLIITVS